MVKSEGDEKADAVEVAALKIDVEQLDDKVDQIHTEVEGIHTEVTGLKTQLSHLEELMTLMAEQLKASPRARAETTEAEGSAAQQHQRSPPQQPHQNLQQPPPPQPPLQQNSQQGDAGTATARRSPLLDRGMPVWRRRGTEILPSQPPQTNRHEQADNQYTQQVQSEQYVYTDTTGPTQYPGCQEQTAAGWSYPPQQMYSMPRPPLQPPYNHYNPNQYQQEYYQH